MPFHLSIISILHIYLKTAFRCSCLLLLTLFIFAQSAEAQEAHKNSTFIEFNIHGGSNYYPGGELEDELDNGYKGFDLRFGWQSYDQENWSGIVNYANYGLGYWAGRVGQTDIFGTPMALYGFINFPIYRTKKVEFLIGPALGVAFNLEPFDPETNAQNDLTGGTMAAFFNPSISAAIKMTESLDLRVGANFIHMSNGGIRQPNTGFDMYGANIGLRYQINRKKFYQNVSYNSLFPPKRAKNKDQSSQINVFQAFGVDQNLEDMGTDVRYLVATTTIEYQHRFNEIHGLSAGVDLFIDESVKPTPAYQEYGTHVFPAVHVGYDLNFWKLAIRPQIGFLVTKAGQESKAPLFMRLGLSVDITNTVYFMAAVKSIHGFKADWADFGLGVHLFKKQR